MNKHNLLFRAQKSLLTEFPGATQKCESLRKSRKILQQKIRNHCNIFKRMSQGDLFISLLSTVNLKKFY